MSMNELTAKLRQLKELQALIEEAQTEADAIKDEVKAYMGESEELHADCYKVTYARVKSSRLDTKKLKADLPDIAKLYTVETETRRFCFA